MSGVECSPGFRSSVSPIGEMNPSPYSEGFLLSSIPFPLERAHLSESTVAIMAHELQHAKAIGYNNVLFISAKPTSSYHGITAVSPCVSIETLAVGAAAGAIDPPGLKASGYRSDLHKVESILGENNMNYAISEARQRLYDGGFSDEIQIRMREIMAYLQDYMGFDIIPGIMLPAIEERARRELAYENNGLFISTADYPLKQEELLFYYNQARTLVEDMQREDVFVGGIITVIEGGEWRVKIICPQCAEPLEQHSSPCTLHPQAPSAGNLKYNGAL